jgi:NAD(P)-dependent dehydrogenase (short-subunit alcohol dehydrogenase family)
VPILSTAFVMLPRQPATRRSFVQPALAALALFALVLLALAGCGGEAPEPGIGSDGQVPVSVSGEAGAAPMIFITGSTDGLGRELALRLAGEGAHLVIHGRNVERGNEVVDAALSEGAASARFYAADFASLDEVRELARAVRADYERLDVLVNNAGVGPGAPGHERVLTDDGNELRFQVNYLAGFLLTHLLMDRLEAATPSRVVNVASRAQQPLDFEDLAMDEGYQGGLAYGRSKLAQIIFTVDLARELEGTGIRVFAVHPAPAMDTELVRETGSTPQTPVAQGVEAVYRVVTGEGLDSGSFFFELDEARAHEDAYDAEVQRRLREISDSLVGGLPARSAVPE